MTEETAQAAQMDAPAPKRTRKPTAAQAKNAGAKDKAAEAEMREMQGANGRPPHVQLEPTDTSKIIRLQPEQLLLDHAANCRRYPQDSEADDLFKQLLEDRHQYHPILVKPVNEDGLYPVVDGFRRATAMTEIIGSGAVPEGSTLDAINAVVMEEAWDDREAFLIGIKANLERKDLNFIDLADSIKRAMERHGMKAKEAAKIIGKSQGHVSQLLSLLTLPAKIQRQIADGKLAMSTGYELSQLDERRQAKAIAKLEEAAKSGKATRADVRKANREAEEGKGGKAAKAAKGQETEAESGGRKDLTYKELKVAVEELMQRFVDEDGGSGEKGWEPPTGYRILDLIMKTAAGTRGAQKRLWDLLAALKPVK
jgi:ParB family chromosome partitioning protein